MDQPIFKKKDFTLCDVKVPDSYPQSQTHVGIAFYDSNYYLTCSPYPVKKQGYLESYWQAFLQKLSRGKHGSPIDAERFENPLFYIGQLTSRSMPPTIFKPLQPFPLMETPDPIYGGRAYNSDPDIFIEDSKVYILNRTYYRRSAPNGMVSKEVLISLICGSLDQGFFHLASIEEFKRTSKSLISPCLIKYNGEFVFTQLETNSAIDGNSFDGLFIQKARTIEGLKCNDEYMQVIVESNGLLPWHMSLFSYGQRLFSIITCVEKGKKSHLWQMLGEFSSDLLRIKIHPRPLTNYNSYRGAAVVVDEEFVLYSTTLNNKVIGSKSVDGRDIIMAHMPMEELIRIVS